VYLKWLNKESKLGTYLSVVLETDVITLINYCFPLVNTLAKSSWEKWRAKHSLYKNNKCL